MHTIIMPQLGQDIETARIVEWIKDEGDEVTEGEVVLVVESDKATFELEAEQSGVLLKILHEPEEEVAIFAPLAYIGHAGETPEDVEEYEKSAVETPAGEAAPSQPEAPTGEPAPREEGTRIGASPAARRVAREKGVDLASLEGTGPGGRITTDDVLAAAGAAAAGPEEAGRAAETAEAVEAAEAPAPAAAVPGEDRVAPFGRMRQRIADRLLESKRTIPHFHCFVDVDMTQAVQWRAAVNADGDRKITVTDIVVKAVASALAEFENMNAHVEKDRLLIKARVNVGVTVAVEEGLLVPVIPDADRKSLLEISETSQANTEAARRGVMPADAVGTFTVSSLGMHGVKSFLAIINPPECGILAVGAIEKRVVGVGGAIGLRDIMTLALGCDHRAVDGTYAAGFLNRVKHHLENIQEAGARWL